MKDSFALNKDRSFLFGPPTTILVEYGSITVPYNDHLTSFNRTKKSEVEANMDKPLGPGSYEASK